MFMTWKDVKVINNSKVPLPASIDGVIYAIAILAVNKACGLDLIAEHLMYDNQKYFVLLALSYRISATWCVTSISVDSFISASN